MCCNPLHFFLLLKLSCLRPTGTLQLALVSFWQDRVWQPSYFLTQDAPESSSLLRGLQIWCSRPHFCASLCWPGCKFLAWCYWRLSEKAKPALKRRGAVVRTGSARFIPSCMVEAGHCSALPSWAHGSSCSGSAKPLVARPQSPSPYASDHMPLPSHLDF